MTRTRLWLALLLAALLAIGGIAAGCGGDDDDGNGDEAPTAEAPTQDLNLVSEGTLTVGTDAPYPPFEIGRPGADFTGFDIEVMNAIAEQLGLEPEYTDTSFDTIFRDVAQGQFDIVAAATTIKPGREKTVDFSDPYYLTQQNLVVQEGSDITSVNDLAGTTVGAQDATTGEDYANEETEADTVRGFPEGPDAIAALATGQVDAVIIDQAVAIDAVEKQGGLEIVETIPTEEFYGFAMSPDNQPLREAVNEALATIKDDGTFAEIFQKYFNEDPPDQVLEATHKPT